MWLHGLMTCVHPSLAVSCWLNNVAIKLHKDLLSRQGCPVLFISELHNLHKIGLMCLYINPKIQKVIHIEQLKTCKE